MSSQALLGLEAALNEVSELGDVVDPVLFGGRRSLAIARAVGRAQVVLLYSHFERYVYAINEEAVEVVNQVKSTRESIPESMRLLHSRDVIEELARTSWERRASSLNTLFQTDGWLWSEHGQGILDPARLLSWMKAANPKNLVRYYRYWGIENIFESITRKPNTKSRFWLEVGQFVEVRHNIAHGDSAAQATSADVRRYVTCARKFCKRSDNVLSRQLSSLLRVQRPW